MLKISIIFAVFFQTILIGQNFSFNKEIILSQDEKDLLAQGEIIVRDLSSTDDDGKTVEAVGLIEASIDEIYQVLISFEDYDKFMPNITHVEILEKNSNHAILGYSLELPMNKIKKYRLEMFYGMDENHAHLNWKMVAWPGLEDSETIRNTTGFWLIKNDSDHEEHVIALYHVFTDPGEIPLGLGWIVDLLTYYSVPSVLINTKERVLIKSN